MEKFKVQDEKDCQDKGCNNWTNNHLVSTNPSGHRRQDFLTLINDIIYTMKLQKEAEQSDTWKCMACYIFAICKC